MGLALADLGGARLTVDDPLDLTAVGAINAGIGWIHFLSGTTLTTSGAYITTNGTIDLAAMGAVVIADNLDTSTSGNNITIDAGDLNTVSYSAGDTVTFNADVQVNAGTGTPSGSRTVGRSSVNITSVSSHVPGFSTTMT